MWAVFNLSPSIPHHHLLIPNPSRKPLCLTIAASSGPSDHQHSQGLGRNTVFKGVNFDKNKPTPKLEKAKESNGEEERQISGSSVLWAMQRAVAQKNKVSGEKKKKATKRRISNEAEGSRKEELDNSNVQPLSIKTDWGSRLNDLEMRLRELSKTI